MCIQIDRNTDGYLAIAFRSCDVNVNVNMHVDLRPCEPFGKAILPGEGSDLVAWCGPGMAWGTKIAGIDHAIYGWDGICGFYTRF